MTRPWQDWRLWALLTAVAIVIGLAQEYGGDLRSGLTGFVSGSGVVWAYYLGRGSVQAEFDRMSARYTELARSWDRGGRA